MNAIAKPSHYASPYGNPPNGTLLFASFQMTDTLQIDLYGEHTEEGGYCVESVTVAGHNVDIVELFSGRQLEKMGDWLDYKDDMRDVGKSIAEKAKHEAMRFNF